jgi:hypothetical protein
MLLGYLSMLILRNIFIEIEVNMMEVGHTHFDCDQVDKFYYINLINYFVKLLFTNR